MGGKSRQVIKGERFGKWKVIGLAERKYHWLCRCDCGTESEISKHNLLSGKSTQCRRCRYSASRTDYTGKRFGHWYVVKYVGNRRSLCRCDCGVEREIPHFYIKHHAKDSTCCCRKCTNKAKIDRERLALIKAGLAVGMTGSSIARVLSLSRQRVYQIVESHLT